MLLQDMSVGGQTHAREFGSARSGWLTIYADPINRHSTCHLSHLVIEPIWISGHDYHSSEDIPTHADIQEAAESSNCLLCASEPLERQPSKPNPSFRHRFSLTIPSTSHPHDAQSSSINILRWRRHIVVSFRWSRQECRSSGEEEEFGKR
jgi:hypothetical protein